MEYHVRLLFSVDNAPSVVAADRSYQSLEEAVTTVMYFIRTFGYPDAGPQDIKIEIRSIP